MSFYERISKQKIIVPDRFDMNVVQITDLKEKAEGAFELAYLAFKFGYIQGVRAERAGKAGDIS